MPLFETLAPAIGDETMRYGNPDGVFPWHGADELDKRLAGFLGDQLIQEESLHG